MPLLSAHEFSPKVALMAGIFLACAIPSPGTAADNSYAFEKTVSELATLSQIPEATGEELREITRTFVRFYRKQGDREGANRALLYAGKASLELYRRSGSPEDLDRAIRYLKHFRTIRRGGPERCVAEKELKSALTLFNGGRSVQREVPERQLSAAVSRPNGAAPPIEPPRTDWNAPQRNLRKRSPAPGMGPSSLAVRLCEVGGNPFCPPGGSTVFSIPLPERRNTVIDPPESRVSTLGAVTDDKPVIDSLAGPPERRFLVVLDPGHGGRDPGTVSPDGRLKEKDVTLRIAGLLKGMLQKTHPNIHVALTREDDRYLSIEERATLTNALDADLFISIHCNASTESSSRGIETYTLSEPSSQNALEVAVRENGIPPAKMNDLEAALLDVTTDSRIADSDKLAESIHKCVIEKLEHRISRPEDRGIRRAPFRVLLKARMPAVLLECAFMTNQRDRRNLSNPCHLRELSDGIAQGISIYLQDLRDRDSLSFAAKRRDETAARLTGSRTASNMNVASGGRRTGRRLGNDIGL